jgi:hypothetical protein
LESELNELEDTMLTEELNDDKLVMPVKGNVKKQDVGSPIEDLPAAPGKKPVVAASQEEDELAALEAELA